MTFVAVARDRVVPLEFVGLLPLTRHYLYVDSEQVGASFIKPAGGLLGEPLITDANGRLVFDYYRVSGAFDVTSKNQASVVDITRLVKRRKYVVANINVSVLNPADEQQARSTASIFF